MKIVIIGAGNVGEYIVKTLVNEGHDLIVIDEDYEMLTEIVNKYNVRGVCGNGVLEEIQKQADMGRADIVISATDSDEVNLIGALVAKSLGATTIIARLRKIEYSKQFDFMRDKLGLNLLINPEQETAQEIVQLLRFPYALNVVPFAGGRINGLTIEIPEDCNLVGLKVGDIEEEFGVNIVTYAVQKENSFIIPDEEYVIEQNDKLSIMAKSDVMHTFSKKIGFVKNKVKNVMIMGGGRLAYYLSQGLIESKISVKIVEQDEKICDEISSNISSTIIVLAKERYYNILQEQDLNNIDAFIALSDDDQENIVLSLYAKSRGIRNIVTRVEDEHLKEISNSVNLNKCVSTKTETAIKIIKFARNLISERQENNPLLSLSKILFERGEVIEFLIDENEKINNIPLKHLKFKKDIVLACIIRDGDVIIPHSTDTLMVGDKILVVTNSRQLNALEEILR